MEHEQPDATHHPAPVRNLQLVLVVDDDAPIADVVAAIVQEAGYEALEAHSGQEALQLLQQSWPAGIICDVMMPRMDGPTFLAQVREQADQLQLAMPAVILMTAASLHVIGGVIADAVVPKPFTIEQMEAILLTVIPRAVF